MKSAYLLTGMPGTGKTSLIKQAVASLNGRAGGFYTEEIRSMGERQGFRIVTIDNQTVQFAHIGLKSPYHVSKYGIDLQGLESAGVEALQEAARHCEVVIIDEIGKMELFSDKFKGAVSEIIDSGKKVLGTIMLKSHPWADEVKKRPQVHLITVTRQNHDQVLEEIKEWLPDKMANRL
jgi:nucleoside-triphosphatase